MPIYRLDYEQHLYVEKETCPTKGEVLVLLRQLHERDSKFEFYTGTWENAIKLLESGKFPHLAQNMAMTNTFVETKFGRRPLTISSIEVHKFNECNALHAH